MSETTTCTRCGRTLRSAASRSLGLGRTCARRIREAASAAVELVKPDTLAKAIEDVEDGALIDTGRTTKAGRRIFAALSSDGTRTYLTTPGHACTCRAGHAGRTCRHAVAAALLSVA
jgi:hypothetical protein